MDMSDMWNFRKPLPWFIVGGILIFLIVFIWGMGKIYANGEAEHEQAALATRMAYSTPSPVLPTMTATPIPVVTQTPLAPGNIYVLASIEENGYSENGRVYDKAVFTNLNVPSLRITAHCSAPSWPSPEVGHQFVLNSYGVLVPIEGIYSPLQRFFVIP